MHTTYSRAVLTSHLFSEGIKVLFRACLALLKANERAILRCTDLGELMECLRGFGSAATDCEAL
jgi:hypothetical protein